MPALSLPDWVGVGSSRQKETPKMPLPKYRWFSEIDFINLNCDLQDMDPAFMGKLDDLRAICGFAITITAPNGAFRPPRMNARVSTTGLEGPHTIYPGRAVDIPIFGERAFILLEHAPACGFTGIGDRQHGPRLRRFVHLDDLENIPFKRPRPWKWTYNE